MSGVRLTTRRLFTSTVVAAGLLTFARMMGLSDAGVYREDAGLLWLRGPGSRWGRQLG